MGRKLSLSVISGLVTIFVIVAGYEIYGHRSYERWRERFNGGREQKGGLTVATTNAVLLWGYRPNSSYYDPNYDYTIETNEHGFRDRKGIAPTPAAGVRRIAFVGDSVTLGLRVAVEEGFVRRFEDFAESAWPGSSVEALNFSVDGYAGEQVCELARSEALRFSPHEVVYMMCLNDFDDREASAQQSLYFRKPKSFLLDRMRTTIKVVQGKEYHRYHFGRRKRFVLGEILALAGELRARGIGFHLVLLPPFKVGGIRYEPYPFADIHAEITRTLGRAGVAVVDLQPAFHALPPPDLRPAKDIWHLAPVGHDLVARELVRVLKPAAATASRSP